jgi:translation initiation factor 3 subunit M
LVIGQVAEPQVNRLCVEAQECMVMNKWVELASLMLTSADLIFSKVAEKGVNALFSLVFTIIEDNLLQVAKYCVCPKIYIFYS